MTSEQQMTQSGAENDITTEQPGMTATWRRICVVSGMGGEGCVLSSSCFRDRFFVRGTQRLLATVLVFHDEQHIAVVGTTTAAFPQFNRLESGEKHFDRAGLVHLFPNDGHDLLQGAKPQRQVIVDAAAETVDHARPHGQLVRGDLGVGRCFPRRGD